MILKRADIKKLDSATDSLDFLQFFSEFSFLVVDDTIEIDLCKVSAQSLTNERKKQDFFLNPQILEVYCSKSHVISNYFSEISFLFHDLKKK
jgi:hypothetical protein